MRLSLRAVMGISLAAVASGSDATPEQRIVSVGGPVTEIVWALGLGTQVVGVDTSSIYPAEAMRLPKVGYQRTLAPEGILALRPTLVVASSEAGPATALDALRVAGVRVIVAPETRTVEDAVARIAMLGAELGARERATQLIGALRSEVSAAPSGPPQSEAPRIVFVLSRGKGAPIVAGRDTAAAAIVTIAGGVNAISEFAGYKPLSPEAVMALSPDVVLTTTRIVEEAGGRDAFVAQPPINQLMQSARLVVMDDLLLLGFGPRLGRALAELRNAFTGA